MKIYLKLFLDFFLKNYDLNLFNKIMKFLK
jgi:hypothetical protein